MILDNIFKINWDIINIYYNKNIILFYSNFVDIILEVSKTIKKTKKYNLIFKLAVLYLENCSILIIFPNFYLMIFIHLV